ncbi:MULTISPECIES: peptidoglycan DD-metalloendopeptidase family protein [Streptomyces]|uniref:peptidoglycan DD-metalloendopeptidase family protein n=1 Tax=Streptomyces TaxID=1883 RepID=UPI002367D76E|nr:MULTISPECIES: peptidoglycan DD-metalloendopeptidase family protein [Streptomyces]
MNLKKVLISGIALLVVSPLAIGLGLLFFVATFLDDNEGGDYNLASNTLKVGKGGVPPQYAPLIEKAANACDAGLPASILAAQLWAESDFSPKEESKAHAKGIAQFIDSTWAIEGVDGNGDGVKNVFDPEDAIPAQGRMMCRLLTEFKKHPEYNGSPIELALAAYNAGPGAVYDHKGVPGPSFSGGETYRYVRDIMANASRFVGSVGTSENPAQKARQAVEWALKQRGGWYQLGGDCTDPLGSDSGKWCDCSSLMQQAYKKVGVDIPRTTWDQVKIGHQVDIDHPAPGDLVFNPGYDGSDALPGHVGMYIGDGKIVEAPHTGAQIRVVSYDSWRHSTTPITRISKVVRVVEADTAPGNWQRPVHSSIGTPYHQAGGMWSSGYHTGVDFVVPSGTPIHAIGPGTVVSAGPGGAYGNQVIIKHEDGMYSQYAHMTRVEVSAGQTVRGGQEIGISGATGNVSGPHLHMEVRTGPAYGSDVDPVAYMRRKGIDI